MLIVGGWWLGFGSINQPPSTNNPQPCPSTYHLPMIHLRSVRVRNPEALPDGYPFDLPIIRALNELELTAPVTFLVGENGSGKSTLLEGIAASANLPTIGSVAIERDETLTAAQSLGRHLVLSWAARGHRGFYMRSEDFFGFGPEHSARDCRARGDRRDVRGGQLRPRDGHGPAAGAGEKVRRAQRPLPRRGLLPGLRRAVHPGGLYLLDEPEVALSPQRQIALLALMMETVAQEAQFVIATHAPMLMAYPGAQILHLSEEGIREQQWDEVEHVQMTRAFLTDPDQFLCAHS